MIAWPPTYAPPKTLAGKLQRGLGAGFLEALEAPRDAVHPLLMDCIRVDPRLDGQVDARAWYYGELARRTKLPVEPIATLLREWGAEDEAGDSWIALSVLRHLAKRDDRVAEATLQDYVTWGPWWNDVLLGMGSAAATPQWQSVAPAGVQRAKTEGGGGWANEPFISWAAFDRDAARLVEDARNSAARYDAERAGWADLPTEDLLSPESRRPWRFIGPILAKRGGRRDRNLIRDACSSDSAVTQSLAVYVRALQGDFSNLDVAVDLAARRPRPHWAVAATARDALLLAPVETALALAREWRSSRDARKVSAALKLLKLHADESDEGWVRARLARTSPHPEGDTLALCDLAEIISARFAGHPFPLLGRRFDAFTYSYGRGRLAQALAATDPTFPTTRAFTGLWDCESGMRVVAAQHVSLDVPGSRDRLQEMAADDLEETAVVAAARARLAVP